MSTYIHTYKKYLNPSGDPVPLSMRHEEASGCLSPQAGVPGQPQEGGTGPGQRAQLRLAQVGRHLQPGLNREPPRQPQAQAVLHRQPSWRCQARAGLFHLFLSLPWKNIFLNFYAYVSSFSFAICNNKYRNWMILSQTHLADWKQ